MAASKRSWLRRHTIRGAVGTAYLLAWLGFAIVAALLIFLNSSRATTLASHDAVVRPTLRGDAVVRTGPVLPDLRVDSGTFVGVDITLGKTDADSIEELLQRYAVIGSQPEGVESQIAGTLVDMAKDAALLGAFLGVVPVLLWILVGAERRTELLRGLPTRQGAFGALIVALVVGGSVWVYDPDPGLVEEEREWQTIADFLGPAVALPDGLEDVEVRGDVTTRQTRRLIESSLDTYDKSKKFYAEAAEGAAELDLRVPAEDETVVALVSDRHDNIGMDAVARAIADRAGATAVFDAGDDTSTGKAWEAFSLDSVTAAFDDYDRWGVAGNHDNGPFVRDYLADDGWSMLDGEVVDGPGGSTLLGLDDPRSSGLGNWRDETGLSFSEVADRLADVACEYAEGGERVTTILVHDANLGEPAVERGCAQLVVGGHVHVQVGPDPIEGPEGSIGYSYTNGTTGGAAYAIAIGSKIRRAAQVSLITYAGGRPVGIQSVLLQTNGTFDIEEYVELDYGSSEDDQAVPAEDPGTDSDATPEPGPIPPGPTTAP